MPGLDTALLVASVSLLLATLILIVVILYEISKVKKARKSLEDTLFELSTQLIESYIDYETTDESEIEIENCRVYRI